MSLQLQWASLCLWAGLKTRQVAGAAQSAARPTARATARATAWSRRGPLGVGAVARWWQDGHGTWICTWNRRDHRRKRWGTGSIARPAAARRMHAPVLRGPLAVRSTTAMKRQRLLSGAPEELVLDSSHTAALCSVATAHCSAARHPWMPRSVM